jgi:hypothetical protein
MAFALVSQGFDDQATSGTSVSKSVSHAAGHLLLVFVRCKPNNLTVSTILNTAGDSFVSCGSTSVDTSNYRTELFYVANSKGNAADNTTVTMNGTVTDLAIAVLEYSGQATGTPFDKAITGNGASGTAWSTASLTPANANELCVSFAVATTAFTGTVGTGYTIAGNNGTTGNVWGEHILGTSSAQTGAWTSSVNEGWQVVQAFFSDTNIIAPTSARMLASLGAGT